MFKKNTSLLIFTACILLAGCDDEAAMNDDMPAGKLISLKTPANFYSYYNHFYNFVNSMDGKLLGSKEIAIPDEDIFEVDKIQNYPYSRYIFTRMSVKDAGTYKDIIITTYYGILPLSKEYTTSGSSSTYLGSATVKFTDVPAYLSFLLASATSNRTSGTLSTGSFVFSLYSDQAQGLFIRLKTSGGDFYKFVDNLIPGQTNTISLSDLRNDFTTADLSFDPGSFTYYNFSLDRYPGSGFSNGSYTVFESYLTTPYLTISYPYTFLPYAGCRTEMDAYESNKDSHIIYYSESIPNDYLQFLDGDFNLNGSFPDFNYNMNLNNKADILYFRWSHSNEFRDANGFRINYYVFISPSVRDFSLPQIPDEILRGLTDLYGINELQLEQMQPQYVLIRQYSDASNFDDWMKKYFFGWSNLYPGWTTNSLYFYLTGSKGDNNAKKLSDMIVPDKNDNGF